ncbi:zinc-binding alcohol dehydrogenase family protein [Millisia brevis]|uniref:zinc-binding alcohol dehydrogenase family protein n=1 Tax=Millisia brevis TaxID=264148 RepID=UPI0008375A0F|nr:zinc-binding alcohol dehydrogenase family protein [Millisia brevis]
MKAVQVEGRDIPPVESEIPEPRTGPGYRIVELVGAGVHVVVRSIASGRHYTADGVWPLVPGVDAVARTADGSLIYTGRAGDPGGTMAQRFAAPERFAIPVPTGGDPLAVAAGVNPAMSSWIPLGERVENLGDVGLGTVVVLGATGTAGRIAVGNAALLGADTVVAVGRNGARLDALAVPEGTRLRIVRLTEEPDTDAAALADAIGDVQPTTVLDYVWGPTAEAMFEALGRRPVGDGVTETRYIEIGSMGGPSAVLPAALLRSRRISVVGSGIGSASPAALLRLLPDLVERIADGSIAVSYAAFPMARVEQAWAAAQSDPERRVVIVPD